MMSGFIGGIIGGIVGFAFAIAARYLVLPKVLERQRRTWAEDWKIPGLGWGRETVGKLTAFTYRFTMPVVFTVVGYIAGDQLFGEN